MSVQDYFDGFNMGLKNKAEVERIFTRFRTQIVALESHNDSLRASLLAAESKLKVAVGVLEIDAVCVIELAIALVEELDRGVRGKEPVEAKLAAMNLGLKNIKDALVFIQKNP